MEYDEELDDVVTKIEVNSGPVSQPDNPNSSPGGFKSLMEKEFDGPNHDEVSEEVSDTWREYDFKTFNVKKRLDKDGRSK